MGAQHALIDFSDFLDQAKFLHQLDQLAKQQVGVLSLRLSCLLEGPARRPPEDGFIVGIDEPKPVDGLVQQ